MAWWLFALAFLAGLGVGVGLVVALDLRHHLARRWDR